MASVQDARIVRSIEIQSPSRCLGNYPIDRMLTLGHSGAGRGPCGCITTFLDGTGAIANRLPNPPAGAHEHVSEIDKDAEHCTDCRVNQLQGIYASEEAIFSRSVNHGGPS